MRRLTSTWIFAVATVVAAAGSASAQTLKADVPFTFRTQAGIMQPGAYEFHVSGAARYLTLVNQDTRQRAVIAQYWLADPAREVRAAAVPMLRFRCAEGRCALLDLWTASGPAYVFPNPQRGNDYTAQIVEVPLAAVKSE